MKLRAQQSQWNALGQADPLWAILADPHRRNGRWDVDEFFATGESEIEEAMLHAATLGYPAERGTALDFGCGVGRLTQALARRFQQATGVDIAPTMLEQARLFNRLGERCQYVLNDENHLRCFGGGSFDFIYSHLTLQHLPGRHIRAYLGEFVRVLKPAGLLLFQVPSTRRYGSIGRMFMHRAYDIARRNLRVAGHVDMYGLPLERVVRTVERAGGRVIDIADDSSAGKEWCSFRYSVTK